MLAKPPGLLILVVEVVSNAGQFAGTGGDCPFLFPQRLLSGVQFPILALKPLLQGANLRLHGLEGRCPALLRANRRNKRNADQQRPVQARRHPASQGPPIPWRTKWTSDRRNSDHGDTQDNAQTGHCYNAAPR